VTELAAIPKKMQPSILAFDAQMLDEQFNLKQGLNLVNYDEFIAALPAAHVIRQRNWLDTKLPEGSNHLDFDMTTWARFRYRQALPYVAIKCRNSAGELCLLVYRRLDGGGEKHLHDKLSAGFGGHTDFDDIVSYSSVLDFLETFMVNALRELDEELYIFPVNEAGDRNGDELTFEQLSALSMDFAGLIVDNENEVGRVHLGILLTLEIDFPCGFGCKEEDGKAENEAFGIITPEAVLALTADHDVEPWTQILAQSLVGAEPNPHTTWAK
jgi:predicted NUDIX family phosphoesterase